MGRPRAVRAGKGLGKSEESSILKSQINNYPLEPLSESEAVRKVWASLASATQHGHTETWQGKQLVGRPGVQMCFSALRGPLNSEAASFPPPALSAQKTWNCRGNRGWERSAPQQREYGLGALSAFEEGTRNERPTLPVKLK